MSRTRRNFSAKFKSELVILLEKYISSWKWSIMKRGSGNGKRPI